MNLEQLQKENDELKRRLAIAQAWMAREVKNQIQTIYKEKTENTPLNSETLAETIEENIRNFFGDMVIINLPNGVIENITAAEIGLYHLEQDPHLDGFTVISSYHKALDACIESFIIRDFRKFSKKQGKIYLRKNDLLEKALHAVVNQGYILSVGRLFHILSEIQSGESGGEYQEQFRLYLKKYDFLATILLSTSFLKIFKQLMDTEVLGSKRHSGSVSIEETKYARKLLIGDFDETSCLLHQLIQTQQLDI
ncbi:MAG: hypothetical protein H6767_08895 [Candidatus Peribacteria bacterium]|nr:MAG: hypothetical protein H6767_08895 [Candidatus Peribacteria bacterium]